MARGRSQLLTTGNFRDWHAVMSSSTNTAAPCVGDIGGPSEQAYTRPAPGRPASAAQYAVDVAVLDHTSWCQ